MKKLIKCQCDDPVCGRGSSCPRDATAEDLRCDVCRTVQPKGPEWVEPGPAEWQYNLPEQ
jgi:hypothetical protein